MASDFIGTVPAVATIQPIVPSDFTGNISAVGTIQPIVASDSTGTIQAIGTIQPVVPSDFTGTIPAIGTIQPIVSTDFTGTTPALGTIQSNAPSQCTRNRYYQAFNRHYRESPAVMSAPPPSLLPGHASEYHLYSLETLSGVG